MAVIAIPNIKLARMTANGASAKRLLRALNVAQKRFSASNPAQGYACSLGALGKAGLIADSFASGEDSGYLLEILDCGPELPNGAYRATAHPVTKKETGYWVFCTDQTARVKASPESSADCFEHGVLQQ